MSNTKFEIDLKGVSWVGFDLDGTLAELDAEKVSPTYIGPPITDMVNLVRDWHEDGVRIKIFTARVSRIFKEQVGIMESRMIEPTIRAWCQENLGFIPEITAEKDHLMVGLIDDIELRQVELNTGKIKFKTMTDFIIK